MFTNLNNLRSLYLNDNQINSFADTCFDGLSSLSNLNLSNNQITALKEQMFAPLSSLNQLNLSNNLDAELIQAIEENRRKLLILDGLQRTYTIRDLLNELEEKFSAYPVVFISVTDETDKTVDGAVVQLKNTKNLQIRSFITTDNGTYYFHGLSPDVDYELKAEFKSAESPTKTLSSFDSRKQAVINLKLAKK